LGASARRVPHGVAEVHQTIVLQRLGGFVTVR
jgi:hypothetical protein